MDSTIFVLLMLWDGGLSRGGVAVVQQEFNSRESCEAARVHLLKAHESTIGPRLEAQGCFKK